MYHILEKKVKNLNIINLKSNLLIYSLRDNKIDILQDPQYLFLGREGDKDPFHKLNQIKDKIHFQPKGPKGIPDK